jgi:hypothetical protein
MTTTLIQPKTHHRSGCAHFSSVINGGAQPLLPSAGPRVRDGRRIGESHEYFRAMREAELAVWRAVRACRIRRARAAIDERGLSNHNFNPNQNDNQL